MASNPDRPSDAPRDGRVLRTERSRKAILDAFYELLREGIPRPSAGDVAERTGIAVRTVYRHFSEIDDVFSEVRARLFVELRDLLEFEKPDGTLEQRAKALVVQLCELNERMAPFVRSRKYNRTRFEWLERENASANRRLVNAMYDWMPELHRAPQTLRDAIEAALSFEHWDRLRTEQQAGPVRTAAAVELATMSLIAQVPSGEAAE